MAELFIPTLHNFAMNNIFTGSCGLFRFRAKPNVVMATPKEVDFSQSTIDVEYWHGLFCYEKSEMEGKETFLGVAYYHPKYDKLVADKIFFVR